MAEELFDRVAGFWDRQAAAFDLEPDHGLSDPVARQAWLSRLRSWLPAAPADIADLGCGTGTLSVLLASDGHRVRGFDLSEQMLAAARAKAASAGVEVAFQHGEATDPPLTTASVDVVLVRHLLWTLPEPHLALENWSRLLRPGGTMVLIEGRWEQPSVADGEANPERDAAVPWFGGVDAATLVAAVEPFVTELVVHPLGQDRRLWGRDVRDERFALVARIAG